MEKIAVSIILPSLNVAQYIQECMNSVVNQTLDEIEIICVDSGSTDGTLEALREYEVGSSKIKLIESEQKSYGKQMNLGIQAARGEYIGIVETDDYVSEEMYEELYNIAKENDVDFVKTDFYRFTGAGKELCKSRNRLSKDLIFYNRIINIEEEQDCFQFPINTWSGIYKREFLLENNIWHNETPGASYQDNGFWFQTFMYAKRAYFIQKPFYMNRRDNPNSSVHSKEKVFCICDEYKYILDILKEKKLLKQFGESYAKVAYQAYRGHFNRVLEEYREGFLIRFSEDFREMERLGILQRSFLSNNEWESLRAIIQNPVKYYRNNLELKEKVYEEISQNKSVIIYGAGMVGKRLYQDLQTINRGENIICFAVSEKTDNLDRVEDVDVRNITELMEYKESLIVIATTQVYHKEIVEKLQMLGFEHFYLVPEYVYM